MDRRRFLQVAAASGLAAGLRAQTQAAGRLRVEYPVDAERAARVLPEGFAPGEPARAAVEWSDDAACFLLSVQRGERTGWFVLRGWTSNERTLRVARESLGLPFFLGEVESGGTAAEIRRLGRTLLAADVGEPGEGVTAPTGPLFAVDFRPNPDWTEEEAIEPGRVVEIARPDEGSWLSATLGRFEQPENTVADAVNELTPVGGAAATISQDASGLLSRASVARQELVSLDASVLPLRYARPTSQERPWMPAGWPGRATAWRLSEDELAKRRKREKWRMAPLELIEIDAMIGQDQHRALLPPECDAAGRPMIKVLGIRSDGGDVAAEPFSEAWLLAFAMIANRPAWYAVSHILSGGDAVYGREALGYPTRRGEPDVFVSPMNFSLTVNRKGREVAYADGQFQGFSTGTTLLQNPIVGLRVTPGGGRGELVYQTWHYQGRRNKVDPKSLQLEFSSARADGANVTTDPWHELGPLRPMSAIVMDSGGMQRSPGYVVGSVRNFEAYYRERGDGVLPWEKASAEAPEPHVMVGAETTRS